MITLNNLILMSRGFGLPLMPRICGGNATCGVSLPTSMTQLDRHALHLSAPSTWRRCRRGRSTGYTAY